MPKSKPPIKLSVKLPPKKLRDKFTITYELYGCKKALKILTKYYNIKNMQIILDSKKVRKSCVACYQNNQAYFKKEGLKKRVVLHEFYHHLIERNNYNLSSAIEEKEANAYARQFLEQ